MTPEGVQAIRTAVKAKCFGCALERLYLYMRDLESPPKLPPGLNPMNGLSNTAIRFGFSETEAHGIMDGWDDCLQRGLAVFKDEREDPGYSEGYDLGKSLYELAEQVGFDQDHGTSA